MIVWLDHMLQPGRHLNAGQLQGGLDMGHYLKRKKLTNVMFKYALRILK